MVSHSGDGPTPVLGDLGDSGTVGRPYPTTPGTRKPFGLWPQECGASPLGGEGVDGGKFSSDRRRPLGENSNKTLPFLGVSV